MRDDNAVSQSPTGAARGLVCTWAEVLDASGRTRMEARWSVPTPVAARTAA